MKWPQNFGDGVREESALLAGTGEAEAVVTDGGGYRLGIQEESEGSSANSAASLQQPGLHDRHYLHFSYTETKAHKG